MIEVLSERPEDIGVIRAINTAAFPTQEEADLVDLLRERGKLQISLVARERGQAIGHIAFSRVVLEHQPKLFGLGLGPMAVVPARQGRGVGTILVQQGLEAGRRLAARFVVVLGHPHYYPRFGFRPAAPYGISCAWEVPADVFMLLELQEGVLAGITGRADYEAEFNEA